jgi:hypothetical protein
MLELLAFILAALAADADVERLRATAPVHLTTASARQHLGAARAAARVHGVDPAIMLSIVFWESSYRPAVVGKETGGRESCGVMQVSPWPPRRCRPDELTMVGGYRAGAERLRAWLDHRWCRGDLRCALAGYAGGTAFMRTCLARWRSSCERPRMVITRAHRIR